MGETHSFIYYYPYHYTVTKTIKQMFIHDIILDASATTHEKEKNKLSLSTQIRDKKKMLPLISIIIVAATLSGAIAYQFWASQTFHTTIHITGNFPVFCNLENPEDLTYSWAGVWNYDALTSITDFHDNTMIRFIVDAQNTDTPVSQPVYLTVVASGDYVDAGGVVGVSVQRYMVKMKIVDSSCPFDEIIADGDPVTVDNIDGMASVVLPKLLTITGIPVPTAYYYEVTVTHNGVAFPGDYGLELKIELADT